MQKQIRGAVSVCLHTDQASRYQVWCQAAPDLSGTGANVSNSNGRGPRNLSEFRLRAQAHADQLILRAAFREEPGGQG